MATLLSQLFNTWQGPNLQSYNLRSTTTPLHHGRPFRHDGLNLMMWFLVGSVPVRNWSLGPWNMTRVRNASFFLFFIFQLYFLHAPSHSPTWFQLSTAVFIWVNHHQCLWSSILPGQIICFCIFCSSVLVKTPKTWSGTLNYFLLFLRSVLVEMYLF